MKRILVAGHQRSPNRAGNQPGNAPGAGGGAGPRDSRDVVEFGIGAKVGFAPIGLFGIGVNPFRGWHKPPPGREPKTGLRGLAAGHAQGK